MVERTVISRLEIEDASAAGIAAAKRNLEGLRSAVQQTADATDDLETNQLGLLKSFEAVERKVDPLARATQQYERDLKKVQVAVDAGAISNDRAAAAISNLEDRLQRAKDKAAAYSASTRAAVEEQRKQEQETARLSSAIQSLESRLNPAAAALNRLEAETNDVREAMARGIVTQQRGTDMIRRLEREYDAAGRSANRFERSTVSVRGAVALLGGALAALGLGLAVRQVGQYADAWAAAENRLRLVTDSQEQLRDVQQGLFDIAQSNFATFSATADLYNRLSIGTERLSVSQERLLGVTDTVAKAIAISGASSQAAEAAIVQFGQALSADFKNSAQELNSIIEQTPGLARALAEGLGISAGQLKAFAKDGKLSTETVIAALEQVGPAVDRNFGKINPTLSQVDVTAKNAAQQLSAAFAQPILGELKDDLRGLVEFLEDPSTLAAAKAFGEALADAAANVRLSLAIAAEQRKAAGDESDGILARLAEQISRTRELREIELARLKDANSLAGQLEAVSAELSEQVNLQRQLGESLALHGLDSEQASAIARLAEQAAFSRKAQQELSALLREASGISAQQIVEIIDNTARAVERQQVAQTRLNALVAQGNRELREQGVLSFVEPDLDADALAKRMREASKEIDPLTAEILKVDVAVKKLGDTSDETGKKLKKVFDIKSLQAEEDALRVRIEAAQISEEELSLVEDQLDIENEIVRIKESSIVPDEKALRLQLETNKALAAELELERRRTETRRDTADLEKLIQAAALGERSLEIAERRLDIESEIAERRLLAERAGVKFDEDAERAALFRQDQLDQQLSRMRSGLRGVSFDFGADLDRVVDSFVDDLVRNGSSAFGNLARFARDTFLDVILSPFKQALANLIRGAFGQGQFSLGGGGFSIFTPGFGGGPNPAGGIITGVGPNAGATVGGGFGGFNLAALGSAALGIGGLSLGGGSSVFGVTSMIGAGNLGRLGASIGNFLGLPGNITGGLSKALAGSGTFGGALGGIGGSLLSGALFGKSTGQSIGSAIGGIAGNLIPVPVLGPLIGSFVGGAIGSLFGGKPSDKAAGGGINFSTFGVENLFAKKNDPANMQARDQLLEATAQLAKQLKELTGGSFLGSGISIQVGSRDGTVITSAAGGSKTTPVGDQQAALDEIVRQLTASLTGGNSSIVSVVKALGATKAPIEDIIDTASRLKTVLSLNDKELGEWALRVKEVTDVFDPLIEKTKGLGAAAVQATAELEAARTQALAKIGADFDKALRDQTLSINKPLQFQAETLLDAQLDRFDEAKAVSTNAADLQRRLNAIIELNTAEWSKFIEQAAQTPETLEQVAEAFAAVADRASAAGADPASVNAQLEAARGAFAESFDKQTNQALLELANAPLARFKALLEAQAARINTARLIGGDVRAAQELAGSQREEFFKGLSDEDRIKLGDFLGLIEDYTGRMGVVIAQTRDVFRTYVAESEKALAAADDLAKSWGQARDSIKDALQSAEDRFGGASRQERLDQLQTRFDEQLRRVRIGDQQAAADLPASANALLELIQDSFGTTARGQARTGQVLDGLRLASELAAGFTTAAENESERIKTDNERLANIEKALQSPDLSLPFLQQQVSLLDTSTTQGQKIVDLLTEYLQLSGAQSQQSALGLSALQISAQQYLGAQSQPTSAAPLTQLSALVSPNVGTSARLVTPTSPPATLASTQNISLAQTQLLSENVTASRGTRIAIEDFLVRSAGGNITTNLTLERIEAASRATPSAVSTLDQTMQQSAADQLNALAGVAFVMQSNFDELISEAKISNGLLQQIYDESRRSRIALEAL